MVLFSTRSNRRPDRWFAGLLVLAMLAFGAIGTSTAQAQTQGTLLDPAANPNQPGVAGAGAGGALPPPAPPPAIAGGGGAVPPPPPPPTGMKVFVAVNGQTTGPFDEAQLKTMIQAGNLKPDTLIWKEGMANWSAASTVAEMQPLLVAAKPAFDAKGFLVGTWEARDLKVPMPGVPEGGLMSGTTAYSPDGSFRSFGMIRVNMPDPMRPGATNLMQLRIQSVGTYTVTPMSETRFVIQTDSTVTMSVGNGIPPTTEKATGSQTIDILDRNTVRSDEGYVSYRIN